VPDFTAVTAVVGRSVRMAIPLAQRYAETNMLAAITIRRRKPGVSFDRVTGQLAATEFDTVYVGKARIYEVNPGGSYELGETLVTPEQTYISIPIAAPRPRIQDDIEVNTHPDPEMAGRWFKIDGVGTAGLIPAARRLSVTSVEPAPGMVVP
jgi:Family of unknown function (DUF6093)